MISLGDVTFRVKADGGIFTKRYSDEFQTVSSIGEDTLYHVPDTAIYYNQEVAPSQVVAGEQPNEMKDMEECFTPGVVGVEQLARELGVPVRRTVKTMLYIVDDVVTAVAVRGDYSVNEIKLRMVLNAKSVQLADPATVERVTGAKVGFAGLIGLPEEVSVVVDDSVEPLVNFELGANRTDYHNVNVNWGRDLDKPASFYDIKNAREGDIDPESGKPYELQRAVEVGNIFPLESKYTDALDLYYTDESGDRQSVIMGSYGIGVSRLMGVIAEYFSDDKGLVWPEAVAPYQVYLVQIGDVDEQAQKLYETLTEAGITVIWDDRAERPGAKFADADLIGIPHRVVVSPKLVESSQFEYKSRTSTEAKLLTEAELIATIAKL